MNGVIPLQGVGRVERPLRSVLIQAGMWNVERLAEQSGLQPQEVMDVLFNQTASDQTVYRLVSVVNTIGDSGQWRLKDE